MNSLKNENSMINENKKIKKRKWKIVIGASKNPEANRKKWEKIWKIQGFWSRGIKKYRKRTWLKKQKHLLRSRIVLEKLEKFKKVGNENEKASWQYYYYLMVYWCYSHFARLRSNFYTVFDYCRSRKYLDPQFREALEKKEKFNDDEFLDEEQLLLLCLEHKKKNLFQKTLIKGFEIKCSLIETYEKFYDNTKYKGFLKFIYRDQMAILKRINERKYYLTFYRQRLNKYKDIYTKASWLGATAAALAGFLYFYLIEYSIKKYIQFVKFVDFSFYMIITEEKEKGIVSNLLSENYTLNYNEIKELTLIKAHEIGLIIHEKFNSLCESVILNINVYESQYIRNIRKFLGDLHSFNEMIINSLNLQNCIENFVNCEIVLKILENF
uniref:Mp05-like protein n=1 Tax=Cavenderia fasciculata TaxID=261658 RepID=B2XX68_CACFS|nr:Mp05-like protein [Cavenderia fasciculata]ABX45190.1 Mp05-like protein [Cavenderia fasciculata]